MMILYFLLHFFFLFFCSFLPYVSSQAMTNPDAPKDVNRTASATVNIAFFFIFFLAIGGLIILIFVKKYCRSNCPCWRTVPPPQSSSTTIDFSPHHSAYLYPSDLIAIQSEQELHAPGEAAQPLRWPPLPPNTNIAPPASAPPTTSLDHDHDHPPPEYDLSKTHHNDIRITIPKKLDNDAEYVHTPSASFKASKLSLNHHDAFFDPPSYNINPFDKIKMVDSFDSSMQEEKVNTLPPPIENSSTSSSSFSSSSSTSLSSSSSSTEPIHASSINTDETEAVEIAANSPINHHPLSNT